MKYILLLTTITAGIASIFPEIGITIEKSTFAIVLSLAYVKLEELFTTNNE